MTSVLESVDAPGHWERVPFGRVATRSKRTGSPADEPLSVYLEAGVVPRSSREDNYNRLGESLENYLAVEPGDTVFNKLRTWQGGLGVSRYTGIVSPAYFVCRPTSRAHPPFLHHLLRSAPYLAELTRLSKWMPPAQFDIGWEQLRALPVVLPPMGEQRAIADYLDTETARIDALIDKKQQLRDVLSQRVQAITSVWFRELAETHGTVALRHLSDGLEQGWSPPCENVPAQEGQAGILMTSAVTSGTFDGIANKRLPPDLVPEARWRVNADDVVLARGSGSLQRVGMAAVAEKAQAELYLSDLTFRLRSPRRASRFLVAAINSPEGRIQIESAVRTDSGQTLKVRADDILSLRVPAVPDGGDYLATGRLEALVSPIGKLDQGITAQLRLLVERRQALITAVVTGELEVPGVAA